MTYKIGFKGGLILFVLIVFDLNSGDGLGFNNGTDDGDYGLYRVESFKSDYDKNLSEIAVDNEDFIEQPHKTTPDISKKIDFTFRNHMSIEENLHAIFSFLPHVENEKCKGDITHVLNGLINHERWALQLFDALPKFPTGLLYGNMYQLGNFEECINVKHTVDSMQIAGQYCLANIAFKLKQNSTSGIGASYQNIDINNRMNFNSSLIHWAICLPSSCTPEDGRILVKEAFSSLIDFEVLHVGIENKDCDDGQRKPLAIGEIIYGSLIVLFLIFILFATIFHIQLTYERKKYSFTVRTINSAREHKISTTKEAILSFSLIQTVTKFLQTKPTELNLECISGIKFLSMMFIIAGHSLIFIFGSPVANIDFANTMSISIENSIFLNSPLLVDSFLLVGGFLICRLLLFDMDKRKGGINFLLLYIARYIRLTPAYLVVLGFYLTWLPKIGDGPLWKATVEPESSRCKESWWTNLLYVNNYVQTDKLCMFQSWYLAVDYHLFIIAPFLVYPLWKKPKVGLIVLIIVAIGAIILPGFITYIHDLDPTLLAFPPEIQDISTNFYFVNAYIKTHMRASSYFLGLLFGYAVHQIQTNCIKIPRLLIWMGWILAAILGLGSLSSIVIFLNPNYAHQTIESVIYAALHRVAWTLAVGWVILVSVTDNAAVINKLLSWKFFLPLSRLTYCAYLVNGVILICHKGIVREAISWNRLQLSVVLFGHLVVTFLLAFVLCICFESPIHGLEKILLKKKDPSLQPSSTTTILRVVEDNENT